MSTDLMRTIPIVVALVLGESLTAQQLGHYTAATLAAAPTVQTAIGREPVSGQLFATSSLNNLTRVYSPVTGGWGLLGPLVPTLPSGGLPSLELATGMFNGAPALIGYDSLNSFTVRFDATPNANRWVALGTPIFPAPRLGARMASLPNGDIILFGGVINGIVTAETWRFSNNGWSLQPATPGLTPRHSVSMAGDPAGILMFGG